MRVPCQLLRVETQDAMGSQVTDVLSNTKTLRREVMNSAQEVMSEYVENESSASQITQVVKDHQGNLGCRLTG